MKMPGFTAEASLYRSRHVYAAPIGDVNTKQGIAPAQGVKYEVGMPTGKYGWCELFGCPYIYMSSKCGVSHIEGRNFTPNGGVVIEIENGRIGFPPSNQATYADEIGSFSFPLICQCHGIIVGPATVHARDDKTWQEATTSIMCW